MKLSVQTLKNLQDASKLIEHDGVDGISAAGKITTLETAIAMALVFFRIRNGSKKVSPSTKIDTLVKDIIPSTKNFENYQTAAKLFEQQHIAALPDVQEIVGEDIAFAMYVTYIRTSLLEEGYPSPIELNDKVNNILTGTNYLSVA